MRVLIVVKASKESEAGQMPSEKLLAEMGRYNEELVKAGVMLAGEGLHPTSRAKRIKFAGSERVVVDGPFSDTKETIAGFWIWQVKSMDEAVAWLRRAPFGSGEELDIRPVLEPDDFGAALTPELRALEERLRSEAERRQAPR